MELGLTGTASNTLCNNGSRGGGATYVRRRRAIRITLMTRTSAVIPLQGWGCCPVGYVADSSKAKIRAGGVLVRKQTQARNRLHTRSEHLERVDPQTRRSRSDLFSSPQTLTHVQSPELQHRTAGRTMARSIRTTNPNPFSAALRKRCR